MLDLKRFIFVGETSGRPKPPKNMTPPRRRGCVFRAIFTIELPRTKTHSQLASPFRAPDTADSRARGYYAAAVAADQQQGPPLPVWLTPFDRRGSTAFPPHEPEPPSSRARRDEKRARFIIAAEAESRIVSLPMTAATNYHRSRFFVFFSLSVSTTTTLFTSVGVGFCTVFVPAKRCARETPRPRNTPERRKLRGGILLTIYVRVARTARARPSIDRPPRSCGARMAPAVFVARRN